MYSDFGFYGGFTQLFPILFGVIFLIVAVMIVVTLIRGISQWNSNNHSPVLTVEAMVTSKRQEVSHRHSNQNTIDTYTNFTSYYATFQVESGDRMELGVSGTEYGMLAEGDMGRLTFQGTRYLSFERGPLES